MFSNRPARRPSNDTPWRASMRGGSVRGCSRFGRCGQHIAAAGRFEQGARIEGGGSIHKPSGYTRAVRSSLRNAPARRYSRHRAARSLRFWHRPFQSLFDGAGVVYLEIDVGRHAVHVAVIDAERDRDGRREAELLNSPPFAGGSGDGVGLSWEQPAAAAIAMAAIVRIVTLFIIVVNCTCSVLCIF